VVVHPAHERFSFSNFAAISFSSASIIVLWGVLVLNFLISDQTQSTLGKYLFPDFLNTYKNNKSPQNVCGLVAYDF
jgi:hypothetical protein